MPVSSTTSASRASRPLISTDDGSAGAARLSSSKSGRSLRPTSVTSRFNPLLASFFFECHAGLQRILTLNPTYARIVLPKRVIFAFTVCKDQVFSVSCSPVVTLLPKKGGKLPNAFNPDHFRSPDLRRHGLPPRVDGALIFARVTGSPTRSLRYHQDPVRSR